MEKSTLADVVFTQIEEKILSGEIAKGTYLTEQEIAAKLGVSRTPVREALSRLKQEGLLKETGRGAEVMGTDKNEIDDIYSIRIILEPYVIRRAMDRMTEKDLTDLGEIIDLQRFYTQRKDYEKIKGLDGDFHCRIYSVADSAVYFQILSELMHKTQRYRKMSVSAEGRTQTAFSEHEAIYDALKQGDKQSAVDLTVKHLQNARDNLLFSVKPE